MKILLPLLLLLSGCFFEVDEEPRARCTHDYQEIHLEDEASCPNPEHHMAIIIRNGMKRVWCTCDWAFK